MNESSTQIGTYIPDTDILDYEEINVYYFIDEASKIIYPEFKIAFAAAEQLVYQITHVGGRVYPFRNLRNRIVVRYSFGYHQETVAVRYFKEWTYLKRRGEMLDP